MMVYCIHVSVLFYKCIHTINISTYVYYQRTHDHKYYTYQEAYPSYHIVGGVGGVPICTGEPRVTFIKFICTGEQPCVTFIKLICTSEPCVTFNFPSSLTYYKSNYEGAHVCPVDHHGAT